MTKPINNTEKPTPTLAPTEDHEGSRKERWTLSLKRYFRRLRHRIMVNLLFWLTIYLVRHWFDFFCYPWNFDDIFLGRHVPWPLTVAIFGGSLAWAWSHQGRGTVWVMCALAALMLFREVSSYRRATTEDDWLISMHSVAVCAVMLFTAAFGDWKPELQESDVDSAVQLGDDSEAAREHKTLVDHGPSAQASVGIWHGRSDSIVRAVARNRPTTRTALVVALMATFASITIHPPQLATAHLSSINCEAHITRLGYDYDHFEVTTTNRDGTFSRHCSKPQQFLALTDAIAEHISHSKAWCGVVCVRTNTSSDRLLGYISEVPGGLPDMYFCRGEYGSFGPHCENEGEDYGYDISREGWMNDIYEPWSILEPDDGADVEQSHHSDE